MSNEECYNCGCCDCMGYCEILNQSITEIEQCNVSEDEKWKHSCWNLYSDEMN